MDKQDYADLVDFLGGDEPRSPIAAIHDAPMQPGWSTVMVLWYDSEIEKCKLAVWDYVPVGDHDKPKPTVKTERFEQLTVPETKIYDGLAEGCLAFSGKLTQWAQDSPY
jgi:hypothetical protein